MTGMLKVCEETSNGWWLLTNGETFIAMKGKGI